MPIFNDIERFVLIGVEFDRKDDGRSEQLDNLLQPLFDLIVEVNAAVAA